MGKPRNRGAEPRPVPLVMEFLLDETGSMANCKQATIVGFNDFLTEQRAQQGLCLMTLTKFDTAGIRTPFVDIDVKMAPDLNSRTFCPGAGTNLRDALINRIHAVQERVAAWDQRPNVLFIAMTDGDDNASRASADQVASLVRRMSDGWTFVYLGADQNALAIGQQLGFAPSNCRSFARSDMHRTMREVSAATSAYRAERAVAVSSSTDFFAAASDGDGGRWRDQHHRALHTNADFFRGR